MVRWSDDQVNVGWTSSHVILTLVDVNLVKTLKPWDIFEESFYIHIIMALTFIVIYKVWWMCGCWICSNWLPIFTRHKREWQSVREGKSPICYQERAGKLSHHLQSQIYTDLPRPITTSNIPWPANQSSDNLSSIDTPYCHP